jgi:hypothetical protein
LEEPGLDTEILLKLIIRKWFGRMYWIEVAHCRDRQWDVVNAVMNFTVSQSEGEFLTSLERVSF